MKNTLITLLLAASSAVAYADDYPVAAGTTAAHTHASRLLNGIVLATPDGSQTIAVPQGANRLLYQDLLTQAFTARRHSPHALVRRSPRSLCGAAHG